MHRKVELLVMTGGIGITTIIGLIVVLGLDTIVGIIAALAAGAGHDPGVALSTLLRNAPLCGSVVALLCTTMLCSWFARKRLWNGEAMHSRVLNRPSCLIVIVGSLGITIVVGLSASISIPEICRHVGLFLSTQWQSIGIYMSSIGWYVLFLTGVAFLGGSLVGLLGMIAGGFSGGLFSTIAGILMNKAKR